MVLASPQLRHSSSFASNPSIKVSTVAFSQLQRYPYLTHTTNNTIMTRISLFLSTLALVATSAASAVVDLTPQNFDDVVLKSGTPSLVEFFAPWCGRKYS
jgi:hypothetical protein